MRTICDLFLEILSPRRTPRELLSEEGAIRALYFGSAASVDPGLVERLLWWEGVEPPTLEMHRVRADRLAA